MYYQTIVYLTKKESYIDKDWENATIVRLKCK